MIPAALAVLRTGEDSVKDNSRKSIVSEMLKFYMSWDYGYQGVIGFGAEYSLLPEFDAQVIRESLECARSASPRRQVRWRSY